MDLQASSRVARLAGFGTYSDLLGSGLTRARIRTMVERGELIKLGRGVYIVAELARRLRGVPEGEMAVRAMAALVTLGPETVVSHDAAAQIHGLEQVSSRHQLTLTRPLRIGSRSAKTGAVVHTAALPASHIGWRLGVPVTTVPRTVVDLARALEFRHGLVVADSALHQNLTSKSELRAVLADCRRWPGVARAAQVVDFADRLAESVLESLARAVFLELGLPAPELQVDITDDDGAFIGRVDFLWRQFRTIAEVDGALKYDNPQRARAELRRDKRLRGARYEVEHFTWREIMHEQGAVGESLWAAFERSSQQAMSGPAA